MSIRYAAKSPAERRNRELEATGTETWSTCLEVIYETDPEVIELLLRNGREETKHAERIKQAIEILAAAEAAQ